MAQNTFALMTNLGRAKEAAAIANGTAVVITHIAIGDGTTVPSGGETALYHEVARKAISGHGTVVGASNVAYFDIFLEASDGPYTIREAGLIDQDGDLIAIARYDPPISKPIPSSGQTVEGTIRLEVAFSNITAITIVVDPSFKVALQRLTRLPWLPVLSMTVVVPPSSPAVGDVYLVPAGATGAWAGQSGKIAEYTSAGWGIIDPPDGHGISLPDGRIYERISGSYVQKIATDVQSGKWLYASAGGTANALTATLSPMPAANVAGMVIRLRISLTNTASATLDVGPGALPIRTMKGNPLSRGDLPAGAVVELICTGTVWMLAGISYSEVPVIEAPALWVRTDGNDSNDGTQNTSASALATIAAALTRMQRYTLITAGQIRLGNVGTYAAPGSVGLAGTVRIIGDSSNKEGYIIQGIGGATSLGCSRGVLQLEGVRVRSSASGTYIAVAASGGRITATDTIFEFNSVVGTDAVVAANQGFVELGAGCLLRGSMGRALVASANGVIAISGPITSDGVTVSGVFGYATSGGGISVGTSGTVTGTATGARYSVTMNGVINTLAGGPNFFPGTTAGSTATGGQYA
ncbi:phage tail-collar fiber domain-containing protein [Brucella intermedia]